VLQNSTKRLSELAEKSHVRDLEDIGSAKDAFDTAARQPLRQQRLAC